MLLFFNEKTSTVSGGLLFYLIFEPTGILSSTNITFIPSGVSAAHIMPLLSTPLSFTGFKFAMSWSFLPIRS